MTYESLAEHTGKSRSGLLYHFPSKEHMVDAARDYAAGQWNAAAERHLPGRFEDASPAERAYAYIVATVEEQQATDGGYFQSVVHAEFAELVWNDVRQRWIDYGEGGARSLRPPGCSGRRRALVGSRCLPDAARCAPWAGHRGAQGDQQAYPVLRPRSAVVVRITRTSAISPRPAHPTGARRSPTTATASRAATAGSARVTVVAVLGDSLVRP